MTKFDKLEDYPPELRARFNSFITTQFDDSLSIEMQIRSLLKWITSAIDLTNNMVEYLNLFINQFDLRLQKEVTTILREWQDTGELEVIIGEALQTQITVLEGWTKDKISELETELETNKTELNDRLNSFETETNERLDVFEMEVNEKIKENREMKVHYFDYPQKYSSKCILIEHNGKNIMIDFGDATHGQTALQKVLGLGIKKIDIAIVTHYHGDHYVGLEQFLNSTLDFSDTTFYLPPTPDWNRLVGGGTGSQPSDLRASEQQVFGWLDSRGINRVFPIEAQRISLNEHGYLKIYNTRQDFLESYYTDLTNDRTTTGKSDYNNFSLVTEVVNGDRSFVFTGDLALKGQENLRGAFDRNIHFYDVEHHGLNHSYDEIFARQLTPKIAVIQNANDNYSYYSRGMYGYLKEQGTEMYITGVNGDITITDTVENTVVSSSKASGTASYGRAHSYSLAGGHTILKANTDLNNLMEAGTYVSRTKGETLTMLNIPSSNGETIDSGFKLVVDYFNDEIRQRQTVFENSGRGYIWYRVFSTNNQWNPWFRVVNTNDLITGASIGEPLSSGADLNTLIGSGKYSAKTKEIGQSILNKPSEVQDGFTVENYLLHDEERFHQILRTSSGQADIYWRSYTGSWNPWWKVAKESAE